MSDFEHDAELEQEILELLAETDGPLTTRQITDMVNLRRIVVYLTSVVGDIRACLDEIDNLGEIKERVEVYIEEIKTALELDKNQRILH